MVASRDIYVVMCINGSALVLCGHDVWFLGRRSMCALFLCTYGFDMLVYWSRCWLGHPHTFSTVNFRLAWEGRARRVMGFRVVVDLKLNIYATKMYGTMNIKYCP
jgi:hypothetical protein